MLPGAVTNLHPMRVPTPPADPSDFTATARALPKSAAKSGA